MTRGYDSVDLIFFEALLGWIMFATRGWRRHQSALAHVPVGQFC